MNKDHVKGSVNEAAGKAQKAIGAMVGNPVQHAKGAAKEAKGKAQQVLGDAKEMVKDASRKA